MTTESHPTRAFVLGLDGVPWPLVEKWIDAGELPNMAAMMDDGAAGSLRSTTPATTPVAWPSIATGVRQDGHGLYGFMRLSSDHTHAPYTREDVRQPMLWDILSPVVVGNVPMTYPAGGVDGKMVTGMMTPEKNDQFASPGDLHDAIDARIPEYEIALDWKHYEDRSQAFLSDLESLVETRRELMHLLMETTDWRLFFFVYTAPDRLQHLLWDEDVILDHYRILDDIVGEVRTYCEEHDSNLFVVSDHGFGPVSRTLNINALLRQHGYLRRNDSGGTRGVLSRMGITKSRVLGALERMGVDNETIVNRLPRSLVESAATQIPGEHGLYDINYAETQAFHHGLGNIYINDTERFEQGAVPPEEIGTVKRDLLELLRELTDPETGERVLSVLDGDEHLPNDVESPDIVVEAEDEYTISQSLGGDIITDSEMKAADHRADGIFFASGPAIVPGTRVTDASVLDVTPTLLRSIGEPVPDNADGRVLDEILVGDTPSDVPTADYRTGSVVQTDDDFSDVEDRLRGLGYID